MNRGTKKSMAYQAKSFRYALKGLGWFMAHETKARIHALCAAAVVIAGLFLKISAIDWTFIVIAIGLVFITEMINSSIEMIVDKLTPGQEPITGRIKDIAAGAVLMSALTALVIGGIIFLPKLFILF